MPLPISERGIPLAVLAGGLLISGLAALAVQRQNRAELERQAVNLANQVSDRAIAQLERSVLGLRGARGWFMGAGVDRATRAGFRTYFESRDLAREFPGVMGVGMIRRVHPQAEAAFVDHVQRQGVPDFRVRTLTPHGGDRLVIQYVEPVETNSAAIGLDVASEGNRLEAAMRALQTEAPFVTGPIRLVQSAPGRSMGLLLILRMPVGSVPAGFGITAGTGALVYSPVQLDQLLASMDIGRGLVDVQIEDRSDPAQARSFQLPGRGPAARSALEPVTVDREVMGRQWRFTVQPRQALAESLHALSPWAVLAAGLFVSLLLAKLTSTTLHLRRQMRERLAESTRLSTLLDHAGDAIIGLDRLGHVTLWNPAAARMFGFAAEEALSRPLLELTVDPDHAAEDAHLLAEVLAGRAVSPFETVRRRRDREPVEVEVSAGPIYDESGQVVGAAKVLRRIGDRLALTRQLKSHADELKNQVAERTRQHLQAEQDLRNVLDAMPSMVGSWDKDLRNRFANREYARSFGHDPVSLQGTSIKDLLGPELLARNKPYMDAALAGQEQRFERDLPLVDGSGMRHTWAQYLPHRQDGEVVGFYVLVHDVTDLKRTQTRLQNIIDGTRAGTWEWNVHTGETIFNTRWGEIVGYTLDELQPTNIDTWSRLTHPDDLALFGDLLQAHFRGDSPGYECEARVRHKDGHWVWVLDRGRLISRTPQGEPLWMAGTRQDISERKLTEQALQKSQFLLDRTGAMARVGGWEVDLATGRIWWSDETCRIHGRPPGHQPTMDEAVTYYAPEARPVIQGLVERGMAQGDGWDVELPFVRADGQRIWVRALGEVQFEGGKPVRLVGAFQDVSVQHEATVALQAQQELLEEAMRVTQMGLAIYDRDDRLRFCNDRYRELFAGEASGVLHIGASHAEVVEALGSGASPDRVSNHREGGVLLSQVAGRHIRVVERQLPSGELVSMRQDVTELVQARADAEAASEAKSAFLASTSHEIRTPLNAILGLTYLLERSELSASDRQQVRQIGLAGRALLALVNDVLDISKIEAGQLELEQIDFDIAQLVRDEAALIGAGLNGGPVALRVTIADGTPAFVSGDPSRLRQMLANLLSNAVKFTRQGAIDVRLARGDSPPWLTLEVADTGIGIDPAAQARLFKPFVQAYSSTTRRYGGTGLGLAISAQLAALMGGTIELDSSPGSGSTFTVRLPLPEVDAPEHVPARREAAPLRVLLAEDDEAQRVSLQDLARSLGWQCRSVDGGQALLAEAMAAAHGGTPYDALVVDWQMPDLDGLTALQRLRETLPRQAWPAAVVISQHELAVLQAAPHAELASALLVKPVDGSRLFNAVNQSVASNPEIAARLLDVSEVGQADSHWLAGLRVLVVDDSSINLDVARKVLELEGAQAITCPSGEQALRAVRSGDEEIDAALLDVQMPDMDGIELLRRLRREPGWSTRPVIALTAGVLTEEREAAMAAGMTDFLPKPLEPQRLIRCLRRHVEAWRAAPLTLLPRRRPPDPAIGPDPLDIEGIDERLIAPSVRQDRALLLSMIRRVLDEYGDLASIPPERLAGAIHKLRGSAGVIGATGVAAAASRVEAAVADGHPETAMNELKQQLAALAASADRPLRDEAERLELLQARTGSAKADALPADELGELVELIEQQSVRALAWVEGRAAALRITLGADALARLRSALQEFDFAMALRAVLDQAR